MLYTTLIFNYCTSVNCNVLNSCRKDLLAFNSASRFVILTKFTGNLYRVRVLQASETLKCCYIKTIIHKYFTESDILLLLIIESNMPLNITNMKYNTKILVRNKDIAS